MDLGLAGAKALVIASRSGLGAATARRFSLEGTHVVINGRNADTLLPTATMITEETGNPVHIEPGDISQREVAQHVVEDAAKKLGGLDILVTNAGGPPTGNFEDVSLEAWDQAYESLLMSIVQMVKVALPYLRESERAAILAITSISAKQPIDNLLLSNAMRAGIIGLVKSLANELGPEGIRVNAILPGWTATERVEDLLRARAGRNNTSIEDERAARTSSIPLRRMGTPEEFANMAVFLCSPAAGFVHGAVIPVDGGEIKATM